MKEKLNCGLAILIVIVLFLCLIQIKEQGDYDGVSISTSGQIHGLEVITAIEEDHDSPEDSSLTSTEKAPDYTRMYPDLYTEALLPKEVKKDRKVVYLTFDDGPSENTFQVLDILEERNIKATFFIVGSAIKKKNEDSLVRMHHEGHTIGIHTYSHLCNEIYCSVEHYLEDFNTVYQQILDITGERVHIYRFPWGSKNIYTKNIRSTLIDEMQRRGFTCYDWNVDTKDSVGRPTAQSIIRNLRKDIKNKNQPIVLMHDSSINDISVRVLPDVIKLLEEMGYEFDTLDNRDPYQFK